MKISRYTFFFKDGGKHYYIYNSLSKALIEVDSDSYNALRSQQTPGAVSKDIIDKDLWELLIDKRFVTEDNRDELLLYKSSVMNIRAQKSSMHLTIAPTMNCNFRCHYCFERGKRKGNMSSDVMDGIVKYVVSQKDMNHLFLTWFGGEPLLALPQMTELYKKLKKEFLGEIHSNIISTAFYITTNVIRQLQELEITKIQITLDGNKESHNKIKQTKECEDVFSKTIGNIDLITTLAPEINVVIRVNLTKENAHEYTSLYNFLTERFSGRNIGIAPAFVRNKGSKYCGTDPKQYFFDREESSRFVLDLFRLNKIYSPWLQYPEKSCNECAIRSPVAIGFDSEGYAYKCWEIIGEQRYAVGKVSKEGALENINTTELYRQLYGADQFDDKKCARCSYLPICHGGCPIDRIRNEFDDKKNECCHPYKGFLADFMRIHLALKEAGYDNY